MQSRRSKFISNFKKEHPERVYAIRDKDRFNAWVSKWTINPEKKEFEVDKEMKKSIFVKGDETESSQQVNDESVMVQMDQTEKILVLEIATWQVMKEVQIHKATVYEKHKLLKELLLPGFDIEKFPYSIQYD